MAFLHEPKLFSFQDVTKRLPERSYLPYQTSFPISDKGFRSLI